MNNTQKRILSDIKELHSCKDELDKLGIYFHPFENNICKWYAIISGTSDTPYEFCNFLFEITIPDGTKGKGSYPMVPPHVKFCTTDNKTRLNPNLYVEGKVCLSILGTWTGPSWVPVYTMKTILMTIQAAVLNEYPLRNEPGYEKSSITDLTKYNRLVEFKSIELTLGYLLNPKKNMGVFDIFHENIKEQFINNYAKILIKFQNLIADKKWNNIQVNSPCYSNKLFLNYNEIINMIYHIYDSLSSEEKKLIKEDKVIDSNSNETLEGVQNTTTATTATVAATALNQKNSTVNQEHNISNEVIPKNSIPSIVESNDSSISVSISKKKTPLVKAKEFDVGHLELSDYDKLNGKKRYYIVKIRSNGVKYWQGTSNYEI